jgi:hypothetical protein
MLSIMLNPRFLNLYVICFFIGREACVNIVEEYDRRPLCPMFIKHYHHLYLMANLKLDV